MNNLSSPPPLSRTACERCRAHKLRCERPDNSATSDCNRCLRKGVRCITELSLRTGRPPAPNSGNAAANTGQRSVREQRHSSDHAATGFSSIGNRTAWRVNSSHNLLGSAHLVANNPSNIEMQLYSDSTNLAMPALAYQPNNAGNLEGRLNDVSADRPWRYDAGTFDAMMNLPISAADDSMGTAVQYSDQDMQDIMPENTNDLHAPTKHTIDGFLDPNGGGNAASTNGHLHLQFQSEMWSLENSNESPGSILRDPDNLRSAILQKLSRLSGDLLQELAGSNGDQDADGRAPSTLNPAASSASSPNPRHERHHIGRMLTYSENFLEIIKNMSQDMPNGSQPRSPPVFDFNLQQTGLGSSLSGGGGGGGGSATALSQLLDDSIGNTNNLSPNFQNPPTATPSTSSNAAPSSSSSPSSALLRPDVPTILAILTSYTCLMRLYNRSFTYIRTQLRKGPSMSLEDLPRVPGLHLCGFKLDHYQNLQLEILARVSLHMLGRIEATLEAINRSCVASGVMEEKLAANLLKTIVQQDLNGGLGAGVEEEQEGHGGQGNSLKAITGSIRRMIDDQLSSSSPS